MKSILCFGDSNTFGTNPSGGPFYGFSVDAAAASRQLASLCHVHAKAHGWLYLDASSVAGPSDLDQLHMEADGHRALAEAVEIIIRKYL